MIVFNTSSWHYRIVIFVFGDSFFTEVDSIDDEQTMKLKKVVWTRKPKVINLCPYCRGVLCAILFAPFVFVLSLIPGRKNKKEKKPFDIKKSRRNTKILRIITFTAIGLFGVYHLVHGNYYMAAFQFILGTSPIWLIPLSRLYFKWYDKRQEKKQKQLDHSTISKNPNLIMTYLKSNHNKICPSIAFVSENDTELNR